MHWDKPRCNQIFSFWIPNIFLLLHLLSHWCVCLRVEFGRLTAEGVCERILLASPAHCAAFLQLTALSFSSSHACCCIDRSTNNWLVPTKQTENKPKWDAFTFPYYTLKWLVIWAFTLWKMKRWVEFYFISNSNSEIICEEIFYIYK